jgi:hypothetical protein
MKNLVAAITNLVGVSFASAGFWANMDHIRTLILFILGVVFLGLGIFSRYIDIKRKVINLRKEEREEDYDNKHKK